MMRVGWSEAGTIKLKSGHQERGSQEKKKKKQRKDHLLIEKMDSKGLRIPPSGAENPWEMFLSYLSLYAVFCIGIIGC